MIKSFGIFILSSYQLYIPSSWRAIYRPTPYSGSRLNDKSNSISLNPFSVSTTAINIDIIDLQSAFKLNKTETIQSSQALDSLIA